MRRPIATTMAAAVQSRVFRILIRFVTAAPGPGLCAALESSKAAACLPFRPLARDEAAALVDDSWLLRTFERALERCVIAWRSSSTRRIVAIFAHSGDADRQIAVVGWIGVGAATAHIALIGLKDLFGAVGVGAGWVVVLVLGIVCIWKPTAVTAGLAARNRRLP